VSVLIDTDIAIHRRDGNAEVIERLRRLDGPPFMSFVTQIELLNGVYRDIEQAARRRALLDRLHSQCDTLPFSDATLATYETIIATTGFSRRKVNDRLIAATALEHGLTLVTMNAADFSDVPGLAVEDWKSPT
jgi:tRNA(fMet)-specific endonuclease VapC